MDTNTNNKNYHSQKIYLSALLVAIIQFTQTDIIFKDYFISIILFIIAPITIYLFVKAIFPKNERR